MQQDKVMKFIKMERKTFIKNKRKSYSQDV